MRWEQRLGRVAAGSGAVAGLAYLVWRVTQSVAGVPVWLGVPALAIETAGVLATMLLVWALWPGPTEPGRDELVGAAAGPGGRPYDEIDVVIRCSGQPIGEVLATLLSTSRADGRVLVDLVGDDRLEELARDHGARYVRPAAADLDGVEAARTVLARPLWLVLDAGDVVATVAFDRLRRAMDDPQVAIVLPPAVTVERDGVRGIGAAERFERRSLRPQLGRRGLAVHLGGPALVRAEAMVHRTLGTSSPEMVGAQVSGELLAEGWHITAPIGHPVVAIAAPATALDAEVRHAAQASAARWLLAGRHGALGAGGLDFGRRAALLAQTVRPLAGVHRGLFLAVLLASLLDGRLPFDPDPLALAVTWLPWFVLVPVGLWLLSGGALRPGDRGSLSMRQLGPAWRGVLTPNGRPDRPHLALAGAFGVRHGAALSGAVALIAVVVGLRGLSDRVTHTLAPMDRVGTAGVLAVTLWAMAMGLDALHLFARPARSRRSERIAAILPGTLSGRTALVVDLTPEGAGVLTDAELEPGVACAIDLVLPTASGCVSAILPATVRNHRADHPAHPGTAHPGTGQLGVHRVGVEFFDVDPTVRRALVEYCLVEPARARLVAQEPPVDAEHAVHLTGADGDAPRRIGLRAAALIAVSGALASAVPASTSNAAAPVEFLDGVDRSGRVLAAGVGAGVDAGLTLSWSVVVAAAAIAIGVVGGARQPPLTAPVRRARRPSPRGR